MLFDDTHTFLEIEENGDLRFDIQECLQSKHMRQDNIINKFCSNLMHSQQGLRAY